MSARTADISVACNVCHVEKLRARWLALKELCTCHITGRRMRVSSTHELI